MKQDVSKLYFLDGTLRKTKQADYSYMSLLKQGLSALGVNPADPGMVVTPDANTANYGSVFTGNFSLKQSLVYDNGTSVGIGTSSPSASYKVDIAGNVNFITSAVFSAKIAPVSLTFCLIKPPQRKAPH